MSDPDQNVKKNAKLQSATLRPKSRKARGSAADRYADRRMPLYAHAAAQNPVLDAQSERELAREITERAAELWSLPLADPAIAPFAVRFTAERIPAAKRPLAGVEGALARARSARDAASRRALRSAADKASQRLIELDLDHEVIDELVADLDSARRDPDLARKGELGRAATTQAFARRVDAIQRAAAAVASSRHRLANANIGLVFHVAAKYMHRGLAMGDLVQEGMLGLIKAIDRFDYRRGFRFSTYATWWIRHNIGRALSDKSRLIRVPVHVQESYQRLNTMTRQLAGELGRDPTPAELARASDLTPEAIEQVREVVRSNSVSLDEPLGDDEDRTRHEMMALHDTEASSAFESIHRQSLARAAHSQMEKRLSRVEIDVLRKRFALDGIDREHTLQEIATTYGLSRERIRQIQDRALQKLRAGLEDERIDAEAA
jgi:RNA polymerase primary sigma factor